MEKAIEVWIVQVDGKSRCACLSAAEAADEWKMISSFEKGSVQIVPGEFSPSNKQRG